MTLKIRATQPARVVITSYETMKIQLTRRRVKMCTAR